MRHAPLASPPIAAIARPCEKQLATFGSEGPWYEEVAGGLRQRPGSGGRCRGATQSGRPGILGKEVHHGTGAPSAGL